MCECVWEGAKSSLVRQESTQEIHRQGFAFQFSLDLAIFHARPPKILWVRKNNCMITLGVPHESYRYEDELNKAIRARNLVTKNKSWSSRGKGQSSAKWKGSIEIRRRCFACRLSLGRTVLHAPDRRGCSERSPPATCSRRGRHRATTGSTTARRHAKREETRCVRA